MRRELDALREKRITFNAFVILTRLEWYRLAAYLLRRWQAPADVSLDDLVQEMLLEAWTVVDEYDPNRGVSIEKFVTWNAVSRAKKWLHRQRSAYRVDDRSPSRHPICFSALDEDAERRLEPVIEATEEEEVDRKTSIRRALEALPDDLDRALLLCLVAARGDIERAARSFLASPKRRWLFRIDDEGLARRGIRRALSRAAASLENAGG